MNPMRESWKRIETLGVSPQAFIWQNKQKLSYMPFDTWCEHSKYDPIAMLNMNKIQIEPM